MTHVASRVRGLPFNEHGWVGVGTRKKPGRGARPGPVPGRPSAAAPHCLVPLPGLFGTPAARMGVGHPPPPPGGQTSPAPRTASAPTYACICASLHLIVCTVNACMCWGSVATVCAVDLSVVFLAAGKIRIFYVAAPPVSCPCPNRAPKPTLRYYKNVSTGPQVSDPPIKATFGGLSKIAAKPRVGETVLSVQGAASRRLMWPLLSSSPPFCRHPTSSPASNSPSPGPPPQPLRPWEAVGCAVGFLFFLSSLHIRNAHASSPPGGGLKLCITKVCHKWAGPSQGRHTVRPLSLYQRVFFC